MVQYKLTYFDLRGFVEPCRQIFHLAGVDFDDVRYSIDDQTWPEKKKDLPFGQLPVLHTDGFEIPQSSAILRYLSKKFGYAGKTAEDEAWVDAIVDQFKDFFGVFRQYIYAVVQKKPVDECEKIRKEVSQPACDAWLKIINDLLEKSKSGYLVGDSLTFADLVVADNLVTLKEHEFFKKEDYPKIAEHQVKIHSLPKLKEWIAIRPTTPF